jgi:ferredoxin-like protein FixX
MGESSSFCSVVQSHQPLLFHTHSATPVTTRLCKGLKTQKEGRSSAVCPSGTLVYGEEQIHVDDSLCLEFGEALLVCRPKGHLLAHRGTKRIQVDGRESHHFESWRQCQVPMWVLPIQSHTGLSQSPPWILSVSIVPTRTLKGSDSRVTQLEMIPARIQTQVCLTPVLTLCLDHTVPAVHPRAVNQTPKFAFFPRSLAISTCPHTVPQPSHRTRT